MNILNEYFERIYCINLDKRTDRWSSCLHEFKKHGLVVERFSATEGNADNVQVLTPFLAKYSGAVGCSLSHLKLLKKIKSLGLNRVLILEDDISFNQEAFTTFESQMMNIPDNWDMLYLSANSTVGKSPPTHIAGDIYKTTFSLTTHAYSITSNLYDLAIDSIQKFNTTVDGVYASQIQPYHNCFIFNPGICTQRTGMSDIANRIVNYKNVIK